jgi:hypothetical protein
MKIGRLIAVGLLASIWSTPLRAADDGLWVIRADREMGVYLLPDTRWGGDGPRGPVRSGTVVFIYRKDQPGGVALHEDVAHVHCRTDKIEIDRRSDFNSAGMQLGFDGGDISVIHPVADPVFSGVKLALCGGGPTKVETRLPPDVAGMIRAYRAGRAE